MKLLRTSPESQGINPEAIRHFLSRIQEEKIEIHSFLLVKNGRVVSECWWEPCAPQYRHQLFSLSKSFTSTAIGMAVSEGLLTTDTLLTDIFRKETEELGEHIDEKMKRMTVKNLLTMGTGMEYENWMPISWDNGEPNNIKNFLSSHIKHEPGSAFFYNTMATYMLSAALTRLTGEKLVDYLRPRLFEPLEIDPIWEEDNLGNSFGGYGLTIRTEDIAKFGQLYLQKGKWDGRQILDEKWIEEATSKQISNGSDPASDWAQGYGYQFWRCTPKDVYRGDGAGGQFCIVMPDENAVVAITSSTENMQGVLNIVWETLLPTLRESPNTEEPPVSGEPFRGRFSYVQADENAAHYPTLHASYRPAECPAESKIGALTVQRIFVDFDHDDLVLSLFFAGKSSPVVYRAKCGEWTENTVPRLKIEQDPVSFWLTLNEIFFRAKVRGEWNPETQTLALTVWHYETPVKLQLQFTFSDSKLSLYHEKNPNTLEFCKE